MTTAAEKTAVLAAVNTAITNAIATILAPRSPAPLLRKALESANENGESLKNAVAAELATTIVVNE